MKKLFIALFGVFLFVSCSSDNGKEININEREEVKKYESLNLSLLDHKEEIFNNVNIYSNEKSIRSSFEEIKEYNYTDLDKNILDKYAELLQIYDVDKSIDLLSDYILKEELMYEEFSRYSQFISILKLVEINKKENKVNNVVYNIDDSLKYNSSSFVAVRGMSRGCAIALAGSTLGTLGMIGCAVPPISVFACSIAVASKIVAIAGVYDGC
ncbi:hypothetical protein [Myroides odoratimimus]|uniref:hypothetical protein n=1 Tax=Myroides odoratimimus TaxID=76832 RepID=UPI00217FA15A|nr:hypothetical protein [Myroides odoratimimus]MCS7475151.1 hypothetical protein [Myroides odoratimimus]